MENFRIAFVVEKNHGGAVKKMFLKIKKEPEEKEIAFKSFIIRVSLILAIMLLAFAVEKIGGTGSGTFFEVTKAIALVLYCVSYILSGHTIIVRAFASLFKGKIEIDSLLITVATLICILIGQYIGAVISMLIFYIGSIFKNIK